MNLKSVFTLSCPKCGKHTIFEEPNTYAFKKLTKMHDKCPECGQMFTFETGFYWGAFYISYGLNLLVGLALFTVYSLTIPNFWDYLYWFMAVLFSFIIFSGRYITRLSRRMWLGFFVEK